MQANYVANVDATTLLDPESKVWASVQPQTIQLLGTPAAMQPTAAIRETWVDKKIGAVSSVALQALHNGQEIAFRLQWDAAQQHLDNGDNSVFPDAAALAFPIKPDAPLMTMGADGMPISLWYWQASMQETARQMTAAGIGTSDTLDNNSIKTKSIWKDGKWSVVISRALQLQSTNEIAQLQIGNKAQFAVAIWDGGNGERGGIKAFSGPAWFDLTIAGRG